MALADRGLYKLNLKGERTIIMLRKQEFQQLIDMGFGFEEGADYPKFFNGNVFAEYLKTRMTLIHTSGGIFYRYANGVYKIIQDLKLKKKLRQILHEPLEGTWNSKREMFYISALEREVAYTNELNPYKDHINVLNGMLSLEDFSLKDHSPMYYSTAQIPCEYDAEADCPAFINYVNSIFASDQSRVALAQEWLGYFLTAETKAQKALILYGSGGNGKGVFTNVVEQIVGKDNISCVAMDGLNKAFTRATIHNKLLILSNENEFGRKGINTQYFKAIVSSDKIQAEHKGKPAFDFKPVAKFCLSMNALPYSGDKSDGYFRRLSILHFSETYSIDKKTADVNLSDTLRGELSGILNWALEGLERLRNNDYKFTDSKSSRMLLKKYKLDINPIMEFIHERIDYKGVDSKIRTENMRVYREFQQWARRTGHKLTAEMSTRRFWNEMDMAMVQLRGKKIAKKRSNTFRYCTGIELKKAEKKDDDLDELFESDNN